MIRQIKFKNVFSFKDEITINFTKKKNIKDSNIFILNKDDENYLKFLLVYGKNNSGKTNLIKAINSFFLFIKGNMNLTFKPLKQIYEEWSFYFSEKGEPISFEIVFDNEINGKLIQYTYGFSFDLEKITNEYLLKKERGKPLQQIFKINREIKDKEDFMTSRDFQIPIELLKNSPNDKLILNLLFNLGEKNSIVVFYNIFNKNIKINFDVAFQFLDNSINSLSEEQIHEIEDFVHQIDLSITNIKFKEQQMPSFYSEGLFSGILSNQNQNSDKLKMPYTVINNREIPLISMSTGTKKIINYLASIMDLINKTKNQVESNSLEKNYKKENFLIMIDEFDSGFHSNIVEPLIIKIFELLKKYDFEKNVQFIFCTHNSMILSEKSIRRDQVIFVDKKEEELFSYIHLLSDKKIRNDLKISKAYLEGKLGGVPQINKIKK